MVGLSCRIYDTNVAFITCHMASDKHGKSRLVMRNRVRIMFWFLFPMQKLVGSSRRR